MVCHVPRKARVFCTPRAWVAIAAFAFALPAFSQTISTVAGNGMFTSSGDGGPAIAASFIARRAAVDGSGNIYISDPSFGRVRKVDVATGIITTVAGNGTRGFAGDGGQATSASFNSPWGLALDPSGNLYIVDKDNNRVRKVAAATGIVTTVAGGGF